MAVCTFADFFGATFKSLRKVKKLSQQDVASQAGFDRSYITLIELGKKNPTMTVLEKMASIVSPSVFDFFGQYNQNLEKECQIKRESGQCPMIKESILGVCPTSGFVHKAP